MHSPRLPIATPTTLMQGGDAFVQVQPSPLDHQPSEAQPIFPAQSEGLGLSSAVGALPSFLLDHVAASSAHVWIAREVLMSFLEQLEGKRFPRVFA